MKSSSSERIPMQLFIRRHDEWIEERVEGGEEWPLWREVHRDRLKDLQHERLIHLIVMMGFALLAFFSLSMWLFWGGIPLALLFLLLLILLIPYISHYWMLENSAQRWMNITAENDQKLLSK